jgi:hypothetical protein
MRPQTQATPTVGIAGGSSADAPDGAGRLQQDAVAGGDGVLQADNGPPTDWTAEVLPLTVTVDGLAGSADRAWTLQCALRQMPGVIRAYVSPRTALAYVDYLPSLVTELDLLGVIVAAGYRTGAPERRFAWRRV